MTSQSIDDIKSNVVQYGFAFLKGSSPLTETLDFADRLGKVLTPWEGGDLQELVPRVSSTPNTYSGIYGTGRFPFHTDLAHWVRPPRYLLLRCIFGYEVVRTDLLDFHTIISNEAIDILTRAVYKPRRPFNGSFTLIRLCELIGNDYCFRWDEKFLKPASHVGEIASRYLSAQLFESKPISISLTHQGDTLLIDNWRMLHARSLIPTKCHDRKIHRVYLESLN